MNFLEAVNAQLAVDSSTWPCIIAQRTEYPAWPTQYSIVLHGESTVRFLSVEEACSIIRMAPNRTDISTTLESVWRYANWFYYQPAWAAEFAEA